jgi:hypothetical protein
MLESQVLLACLRPSPGRRPTIRAREEFFEQQAASDARTAMRTTRRSPGRPLSLMYSHPSPNLKAWRLGCGRASSSWCRVDRHGPSPGPTNSHVVFGSARSHGRSACADAGMATPPERFRPASPAPDLIPPETAAHKGDSGRRGLIAFVHAGQAPHEAADRGGNE